MNTLNVPRDVRTVPQNFEIDNDGPNFPRGYNDDFEYRNGLGFCCCTIPQLISCMCIGSGIALLFGIFELYSLITILAIIKKGEDVTLWLPENSFITKYAEAEQNENIETPGALQAMAALMIVVSIFAIVCRGFVCYYLYPIAMRNARTLKDRQQALKAPIIYIAMDVIYAIFELAGGLVVLNLYKEE